MVALYQVAEHRSLGHQLVPLTIYLAQAVVWQANGALNEVFDIGRKGLRFAHGRSLPVGISIIESPLWCAAIAVPNVSKVTSAFLDK